jgi:hypothetical protein
MRPRRNVCWVTRPDGGLCRPVSSVSDESVRIETRAEYHLLQRIVSGGQTGVDRAALDAAIERGIPHGGWCPKGRLAEDGVIPLRYRLIETESSEYLLRTQRNVADSDATLILNLGPLEGGSAATLMHAVQIGRPHLLLQLDETTSEFLAPRTMDWLKANKILVLNVAGPRESERPGAYAAALRFLRALAT